MKEYCHLCYNETGRAGRSDDPIYVELLNNFMHWKAGEELGPICLECYKALIQLELVNAH